VAYLGLGLAGVLLQGATAALTARRTSLRMFRPAAPVLDVGAQAFVLARMGGPESPYLLLLALPILVWGVLRGISGGIWAAGFALAADALLLIHTGAGVALPPVWLFHAPALILLGIFSGLLGRRIQQEEVVHRRTRRELEQAQLDAEVVISQLSRGLLCLDGEGRLSLKNDRADALLSPFLTLRQGATLVEILQESPDRAVPLPLIRHLIDRLAAGGEETHEIVVEWEERTLPRRIPLEITTSPILDREGKARGMLVHLSDLTERSERDAEARHRERLALIGELSAGLAHEIRNSLKPITGSVELLRQALPPGESRQDSLMELILRESESLENFITEFLNFARDKNLEMSLLPLEKVLGEEWESLNSLPRSPFRLIRPAADGPTAWVRADRTALRQVVRNLGINALEAGGEGIEIGWKREGSEAVVFLRDHGPGIPEAIRSQVFEPFFTTKPTGTGLGLAIARELTDRLGGRLTLEPAEGGGTMACIRLPLQPAPDPAEEMEPQTRAA